MKKTIVLWLLILVWLLLPACKPIDLTQQPTNSQENQYAATVDTNVPESTGTKITEATENNIPEPTETKAQQPQHSALYIPGVTVEQVIGYFNEVCLDAEFVNGGNPSVVQKWTAPIYYMIDGTRTQEDMKTLSSFESFLNEIEGFPGISQTDNPAKANLQIYFGDQQKMLDVLGSNFKNLDGGVTFWYSGANKIYNATICYRTDIDQQVRNSVILEEIYNGLGPVQDTDRTDSIIYKGFSTPQWLTDVDVLILQLLYHPDMRPGMNTQECEQVIRNLYW